MDCIVLDLGSRQANGNFSYTTLTLDDINVRRRFKHFEVFEPYITVLLCLKAKITQYSISYSWRFLFSAPEPKAQVHYCDHALSVVCPSVRPSVRPSVVNFHIFDFFSETAERNSTTLDRKQDLIILYQVCVFRADQKKDGRPGLWLTETFSTSLLKLLNGIQRNLTGSKISPFSTKFVFLGRSEKQDGRLGLWLVETFSTSFLKPLNGIQRNLTGNKISTSSTKFGVFLADQKNNMAPGLWLAETFWLLLWNRWAEFNETWLAARSQCPLPNLCFSGRLEKNKMAAMAFDWLRRFRLLLNCWTEFNLTWQGAKS